MNVNNLSYMMLWFLQINARLHLKQSALRVVGGQDGDPEIHQHIVRMEMKITRPRGNLITTYHICTATVITPVWVLTAAHCIERLELDILSSFKTWNHTGVIRYGSVIPETNGTFSDILAVQKHPHYLNYEGTEGCTIDTMRNDIGLMKTAPIHLNKYGKLSAVDYKTLSGHAAVAAGYGGRGLLSEYEDSSDKLLTGTLQVMDVLIRKCTELDVLFPSICLSRRCGHSGSLCPGDSGGPLLHLSGVVGIISKGDTEYCYKNMMNMGNVYNEYIAPVSPYIEWIKNHMKQNGMT